MTENDNIYINFIEKIIDLRIREECGKVDPEKDKVTIKLPVYGTKWYNSGKAIDVTERKISKVGDYYEEAKVFIEMKTRKEQTFMSLWSFCDFIRWSEKLFLYHNNEDDLIFCDSPISNIDTKTFVINREYSKIYFRLTMPKTLDMDSNKKLDFHKKIDIVVERNYGKEMKNKYVITDEEFKCNDNSDVLLMNYINVLLNDAIYAIYMKILINARDYLRKEGKLINGIKEERQEETK